MATYEPPKMNPLIGRRAEIVCNIQNLPVDVTVQWMKDGRPFNVQNTRVRFLNNNRKIEFSPVYANDAGSYECVADTEQREAYTTSVKVFTDGMCAFIFGSKPLMLTKSTSNTADIKQILYVCNLLNYFFVIFVNQKLILINIYIYR